RTRPARTRGALPPRQAGRGRAVSPVAGVEAGSAAELVLPLTGVGRQDLARAGGKGANLGELIHGGFPVPTGFVVSTAAYDGFVDGAGLTTVIEAELARAQAQTTGADDAGSTIRAAFEAAAIPELLASK